MTPGEMLEDAYRLHGPRVLAYLSGRVRDRHDCEELLQEVFVIVARDPAPLLRADSQLAWLIGIARNLAREHGRRRSMPQPVPLDSIPARTDQPPDELGAVRDAINRLPGPQREVLELRLRDELTYAQIAEALSIPIGTVRSRIHHAVRSLKESAGIASCGDGRRTQHHE